MSTSTTRAPLAAIVAVSDALARAAAERTFRPLVPGLRICPECGATAQIACPRPGTAPCRACAERTRAVAA
ncbi:hypothetical protein ACTZWW_12400 [Salinarimonas sp. NSM]|uniref:hypothetical protein n=1 Tax=Salinarimonas sp. NSM TaxID=3458003 RepID=UPI00403743B9